MAAETFKGLQVEDLSVTYRIGGGLFAGKRTLKAVRSVSFQVDRGETLGIVGESGCGKSSLARALVGLAPVSGGVVRWNGQKISGLDEAALRPMRRDIQMVFQDPFAALNPRMRVVDLVAEPLRTAEPALTKDDVRTRVVDVLKLVGLESNTLTRHRHELSGGQAQRVGIARAVATRPGLLICDEAVSALDVSVQATVLNLLKELQQELNLALVFISHDLGVVKYLSDQISVLYLGQVVESGHAGEILDAPAHPYTQLLRSSSLSPKSGRLSASDEAGTAVILPSPMNLPTGCVFKDRCPQATRTCEVAPALQDMGQRRFACHHPLMLQHA